MRTISKYLHYPFSLVRTVFGEGQGISLIIAISQKCVCSLAFGLYGMGGLNKLMLLLPSCFESGRVVLAVAELFREWPSCSRSCRVVSREVELFREWSPCSGSGRVVPGVAESFRKWPSRSGSGRVVPGVTESFREWFSCYGSGRGVFPSLV